MSRVTTEVAFVPPDGFLAPQDILQRHWISNAQCNSVLTAAILYSSRDSNDLPATFSVVPSCKYLYLFGSRPLQVAATKNPRCSLSPYSFVFCSPLSYLVCSNVFLARYFDCKEWSQASWGETYGRTQQERRSGGQGELLGQRHVRV